MDLAATADSRALLGEHRGLVNGRRRSLCGDCAACDPDASPAA